MKIRTNYSLRPIILFANIDVFRHIFVIDTSVFVKSNMGRRSNTSLLRVPQVKKKVYRVLPQVDVTCDFKLEKAAHEASSLVDHG
jgi:hypothetical protein